MRPYGSYAMMKVSGQKPEKEADTMDTKLVTVIKDGMPDESEITKAAQIIKQGGLVAFPTETVYGLGANALEEAAAKKIYEAKGRPSDNPLIAHIASMEELEPLVLQIPDVVEKLADRFWPGPLTLVMKKSAQVPYGTTGGLDTVAVRMPDDPVASRLIALSGVPIAAPSANRSGRPSPTTAEHVLQDMDGRIDMILDGGPVGIGVESTILDVSGETPVLLRPGAVTLEMLRDVIQTVDIDPATQGPLPEHTKPKAPGMKYRHYAPKANLTLVEGETSRVVREINRLAREQQELGRRVGIICTEETRSGYPAGVVKCLGERGREETLAHNLFAVLRAFDDEETDVIYSESFSRDHLGQAIMNRLTKAAGYHMIQV